MAISTSVKALSGRAQTLLEAFRGILLAWMVLMTLWGMFSGWWTYKACQRLDIKIDYLTGTYVVASPLPDTLEKSEKKGR